MTTRFLVVAGALCLLTPAAHAQVGYKPDRSPYRDLEHRQEITFIGGQFRAQQEPASVAPRSGPLMGVGYELRMAGPAYFTARLATALSERNVIDPTKLLAERSLGTKQVNMLLADVGFALNLTGYKSWHGFVPSLGGGVGMGSAFDKLDKGGYRVGSPFLFTLRPALKIAAGGRWGGRIEATNYFYRVRYPESYFVKSTADPTVLPPDRSRNLWRRNVGLAAGLTYNFGR
ncbi:MAG: hypothetical protein ABIZ91_08585 [Gemmatimonadaceae bacterium]